MKIETGYVYRHPFVISQEQVQVFAELTGDTNPLHTDAEYARSTMYGQRIIPGFLGGSVFSKVFGTIFPGEGTIYLKQEMKFYKPMFPGEVYTSVFEVLSTDPVKKRIVVKTTIVDADEKIYILGEAILQKQQKFIMGELKIGKHTIGFNHKPFIIAEMSGNHNQSIERAIALVDAAAAAGAHALKLQTFTADTITMKGAHTIHDKNSLWDGKELHGLYASAATPWEWHQAIFDRAKEKGMAAFSSPFDESAVDFLETLNVPAYKIASFENTHHPLLRKVAATGKPVIVSTGVATISDIAESVSVLRASGCNQIILLKCTSTYPATPENTNLLTLPHLAQLHNCTVGLSDHTMGIGASVAAVALGARVIEKHFTLRRADGGVDSAFSLEPEELKNLVIETERAFLSLGRIQYGVQKEEENSLIYKRSIYVSKEIKAGENLSTENLKIIRPATGLAPKYWDIVIGKKAKRDIKSGTPLSWDSIL